MKRIQIWLAVDTDGSVITTVFADPPSRQPHPELRALAEADVRQTFEDDDDIEELVARTMADMRPVLLTIEAETEEELACGLVAGHPELFAPGHHHVEAARQLVSTLAVDLPEPPPAPADPIAELITHLAQRNQNVIWEGSWQARQLFAEILRWHFARQGPFEDDCVACGRHSPCVAQGVFGTSTCEGCIRTAVWELVRQAPVSSQPSGGARC